MDIPKSLLRHPVLKILAFLILSLNLSCLNETQDEESAGGNGVFPHPDGWELAGRHGQAYLADMGTCTTSCHGEDLAGGFSGVSCTDCHKDFPHPEGWVQPAEHGEASRPSGALTRCGVCHGRDFDGGRSHVSCLACHPLYPHVPDWVTPATHGQPVIEAGSAASCATACHGTDFLGGLSGISCFACHQEYPHGDSWADFDRHGAVAKPDASVNCASLCHGEDFRGGDTQISCYECHSAYPHNWEPHANHYSWVRANGDTTCITAQGCHNDFRGPVANPPLDCTSFCHRIPEEGAF